jgi:crossover junction endodeoxyribonuclease RuvC
MSEIPPLKKFDLFLGIDPGLSGACAMLSPSGELIDIFNLPTKEKSGFVRHKIDGAKLYNLIGGQETGQISTIACVEMVGYRNFGNGVLDGFSGSSLAHSLGVIEGVLGAAKIPYVLIEPMKWKTFFGLINKDKKASVALAKEKWPDAVFKRHDHCEAALLADILLVHKDSLEFFRGPDVARVVAPKKKKTGKLDFGPPKKVKEKPLKARK